MNRVEQSYISSIQRIRELYLTGDYEESKDSGYSKRALEAGALEDFEEHLEHVSEYLREDVREEEMRIASDTYTELARDVDHMTAELRTARADAFSELISYLKIIKMKDEAPEDAEAWAYQDGWNAAVEQLTKKIEVVIKDAPRIEG